MSTRTKIWLVIAVSLILVGCMIFGGAMTVLKWDFRKLSTFEYETNSYEIDEEYTDIVIKTDTADVVFVPSENSKTSVVCYEQKNVKHSVSAKDGTLKVELTDTRKWYEYIGINFGSPRITVYISKAELGAISVKSSTGGIRVENVSAGALELSVSTGKVTVSNVSSEGDVKIKVSTGKTYLTDIKCKNIITSGNTGDIYLKNVIAAEKFSLERSTGDVKLENCDAAEIFIETDTGNVKGSLLSDKIFMANTGTGSVNVPKTVSGGRCEIKTSTGNIKIEINR